MLIPHQPACVLALAALALSAHAQTPLPAPASTTGASYVEPSTTAVPAADQRVGNLLQRGLADNAVVQKLGPRTWWVHKTFYNALFYVGDKGVLVFDAPAYRTPAILKAIRTVTDKPVTAIVYSHFHADHIGDAKVLLDDAAKSGVKPRIIATAQTAAKMVRLGSQLPRPTETVAWPDGSFRFEGLRVRVSGFAPGFHTDDHSAWLLEGHARFVLASLDSYQ
jgi:glyoxylase-like metal-dependent hydrolase (beta-lactamase superfamily II)